LNKRFVGILAMLLIIFALPAFGQKIVTDGTDQGTKLGAHYEAGGIFFNYPEDWIYWENASFNRIRDMMKSQPGLDLLVMLKTKDDACTLQVGKIKNPSSFDSFYKSEKKFADQIAAEGIDFSGMHYGNYSLNVVELPINQKAILVYAERQDGQVGVSYKLLSGGYEYTVNFIYNNKTTATEERNQNIREGLMNSLKITGILS